jgi:hypothetical protein
MEGKRYGPLHNKEGKEILALTTGKAGRYWPFNREGERYWSLQQGRKGDNGPYNRKGKEVLAFTTGKVKKYWPLQHGR